jgi:hypothetical protein
MATGIPGSGQPSTVPVGNGISGGDPGNRQTHRNAPILLVKRRKGASNGVVANGYGADRIKPFVMHSALPSCVPHLPTWGVQ